MKKLLAKAFFVIFRDSMEEKTVAIVTANVDQACLLDEDIFKQTLEVALNDWRKTEIGLAAWKRSSEDFNVGDLAGYTTEKGLITILGKYGIYKLDIENHSSNSERGAWSYDTVLMSEEDDEPKEKLEGICCSCQSRHPVVRHPVHGYVMDHHDCGTVPCDGIGMSPQVVIKNDKMIQSDSMYDIEDL
jgi:hypothetical protein